MKRHFSIRVVFPYVYIPHICLFLFRESRAAQITAMESSKKVLVLGAGFVSAPVVDYLTRDDKTQVTVGKCCGIYQSA